MPVAALIVLAATWGRTLSGVVVIVAAVFLAAAVLAAVHHAEVVAHRVGEPFGSLVLAVAVTVIEVALIVTLMLSGGSEKAALARDTVFAALMITCNGIVGASLLVATLRKKVAVFSAEGSGAMLATITSIAVLSLVLPAFTTTTRGPTFSGAQLTFAALASLGLYALFVFVQTVRHRDYFQPIAARVALAQGAKPVDGEPVVDPSTPTRRAIPRPWPAWGCSRLRWSASSAWRRVSRRRSRVGCERRDCRSRWSVW